MGEWKYSSTHKNPGKSSYYYSDGGKVFIDTVKSNTDTNVRAVTKSIAKLNNSLIIKF